MSDFMVLDGTGTGRRAKVNTDNQLLTRAVSLPYNTFISDSKGLSFSMSTGMLTMTTTAGVVMYFKNTDSESFHIQSIFINWNGGSTNFNRPAYLSLYIGTYPPSANHSAGTVRNLNTSSGNTADMDFYIWDEVSTGMTTATNGVYVSTTIASQGLQQIAVDGALIVSQNTSVGIVCDAEEIGELCIHVTGYYEA